MAKKKNSIPRVGPPCYENWRAHLCGKQSSLMEEYPFYTDARIIGEVTEGYGPYQFFNTVPGVGFGTVAPSIVLRQSWHLEQTRPDFSKTNVNFYHGGSVVDEIAALVSLTLGTRIKAGPASRIFHLHGDPLGRPIFWFYKHEPSSVLGNRGPVIPNITGEHPLSLLEHIKYLPNLSNGDATVLIRAARLYQDSMWISDSEPAIAWLMLVSAIEVVASHCDKNKYNKIEKLKVEKQKLYQKLEEVGDVDLADMVAKEVVTNKGSTNKFINFILRYLPSPPEKRPLVWAQLDYDRESLKDILSKIYDYRSKALHGGIPFPAPMCEPPYTDREWDAPSEKPIGLGAYTLGGMWIAEDIPILLHSFEYIVRHSLLNWFKSLSGSSNDVDSDSPEIAPKVP